MVTLLNRCVYYSSIVSQQKQHTTYKVQKNNILKPKWDEEYD